MLTIDKVDNFKVEKRKLLLPKPDGSRGNLIFLPYMTPDKCSEAIKSSTMFVRMSYWKNIYRDYRYNLKLFNKRFRYNNMRERNDILDNYQTRDKSLKGIKNLTLSKNKNCYIDISPYMTNFFNFHRKSWKLTISEFMRMMNEITNREEYNNFNTKIVLLNINTWDTDRKTVINKYNILSNPFAIIYLALRKDYTMVQSMGNLEIFITDGDKAYFKFNPVGVDKMSYLDFKLALTKIRSTLLDKDLDDDKHLDTYGTTSSNAPAEELERAKAELTTAKTKSNGDEDVQMSLMDELDRLADGVDPSSSNSDDDEEEPEEDRPEDLTSDSDGDTGEPKPQPQTDEEDEEDDFAKALMDEMDTDEDTAKEVQRVLAKKVPDRSMSARERQLKEQQLRIKLDSGKTLAEILDNAKNNPSMKKIPEYSVDDKVKTLNKGMTKISFPNFEKAYNDQVFEHDFYGIFNALSDKKDLPVYIRKISKVDTSDSLNQKETYTIEMEDPTYHRRMSIKIDVPKFVEGKFMYLSGNKKMFVKQLILKPIVKIAPDTVQICTNYNKIFMYRYGDNISPKTQNVIKLLLSNTKYFNIRKGNSVPLNADYKTSIEYDTLAKHIITLRIKNSKVTFFFSQPELNTYVTKMGYEKEMSKIDRDKELIIGIDETNPKVPEFIVIDSDDAAIAAADFNNGEDIDPDDSDNDMGVIELIMAYTEKYNPSFNPSTVVGEEGIKMSKKYVYSRCRIMKKYVPTIMLLAYTEGLSTVLRKAGINNKFQKERPRFENNLQKLDTGVIQFADGYLLFDRYPIQNSLLMNAFTMIDTKAYDYEDMDRADTFSEILSMLLGTRQLASAFDAFYDNMIDPITKELLESMNYPTDFVSVLLFANVLLCDNNYTTELDMNNFRVRSNEMVNALLYKVISNAYSKYKRTAMNRTPVPLSVPPGALIKEIVTSQSVEDYSRLNPILEAEKSRAITCKGPSGINLDESYTEEKRCFDKTMTGLLAMTTSPDGNCGVVRQLCTDPKIVSPRGFIDTSRDIEGMNEAQLFSPSDLAIPGAGRSDDSIRTSMMFKQNKAIIPVKQMDPVLISNGFEKVFPYHLTSDFTIVAEHDGKVLSYDEATGLMAIEYTWKEGKETRTKNAVINLSSQISKNGGGGFFLATKLKAYVKPGNKFKANDVLAGDDKFFGNYSDGIKFNIGTLCKVACMSAYNTYEDSTVISTRLSNKMSSKITMEKHIVLGPNANILKIPKPGDSIAVNDSIIEYEQDNDDAAINKMLANIDEELKERVTSLSRGVIRSKYTGVIEDIKVYSASDLDELSPSLRKVVSAYWKRVKSMKDIIKRLNIQDAGDTGNVYMMEDKPIKPVNGKIKGYDMESGVLILIYITYVNPFSIGDKMINFAALKGVTSEIWDLGKEPYSDFRPDEEISAFFPPIGLMTRKTPSVIPTMFGNKLLIELKRKLGEMYLGHYDYTQDFDYHIDGVPDRPKN